MSPPCTSSSMISSGACGASIPRSFASSVTPSRSGSLDALALRQARRSAIRQAPILPEPASMRTETPQIVRLEDYRPSDFLIDRVELDIRLDPTETRIVAILAVRANPEG